MISLLEIGYGLEDWRRQQRSDVDVVETDGLSVQLAADFLALRQSVLASLGL